MWIRFEGDGWEMSICIGGVDGVTNEYEPEFEFGGIRGGLLPGD